jgi:hypothetical protein
MRTQDPNMMVQIGDDRSMVSFLHFIAQKIAAHELTGCVVAICDEAESMASLYVDSHGASSKSVDRMTEVTHEVLFQMRSDAYKTNPPLKL